jgi:hypothetical protein
MCGTLVPLVRLLVHQDGSNEQFKIKRHQQRLALQHMVHSTYVVLPYYVRYATQRLMLATPRSSMRGMC